METQILQILVDIVATALATALICLIRSSIAWVGTKCKSERTQFALQEFQTVLEDGVGYTEQTFVRLAKASGTWNSETQLKALQDCMNYIKNNLTQKTLKILTEDKDNIDEWIKAKIESYISYQK